MKYFLLLSLILFSIICKDKEKKNFKFTTNIKVSEVDTNDDKKIDSRGYYMDDPGNFRFIYTEVDKNLDGFSDYMVWLGSSSAPKLNMQIKDAIKVHEEEDEDFDGKIDAIKWFLPNEYISLVQRDKNKDGYFETTVYYNFAKIPVRTEIDTNFDGRADQILWETRAELDTDFDGVPDKFLTASTKLILEDLIAKKIEMKSLNKKDSWLLNQSLIPAEYKSIIGSGYN